MILAVFSSTTKICLCVEIAEGFSTNGAKVYITGRRGDVLESAAKELNEKVRLGGQVVAYGCDLESDMT